MLLFRNLIKNIAFNILDRRKQRGFHLMHDLIFWSRDTPIEIIFDVGANIGQTVIEIKQYFPNARVEAFEPIESTFKKLKENCSGLPNVTLNKFAFGSKSSQITIELSEESLVNSMLNTVHSSALQVQSKKTQEVMVETIDNICDIKGIKRINLLKTDTEGYDLEVLRGAKSMLLENRIDFILSEATFDPTEKTHTYFCELNEYLYEHGYKAVGFYDICHTAGSKPSIWYCNVLYANGNLSMI
ncbi:MAG: FkbM family methyltransferase [Nostoc sp. SerVER01]|nr:FkbM family methyltransferase [Nostoc sp. SerVER01]MDZ8072588.1 FkbM family methyltransferase [Nostoc sp. DedQUE01]